MSLETVLALAVLALVALIAAAPILYRRWKHDREVGEKLETARRLGLNETLTLHPVIDEGKCIGCAECVRNCPEQDVLDTYRHKAVLVNATECVGPGVCERVCPVGAVGLAMGTATRGIELPRLTEAFETSVPDLFVVGELGGMGLIRNAIWQATQAVGHIATLPRAQPEGGTGLLIVGAGPAGLAAALSARAAGMAYRVIEQETVGGSMLHYPRRKLVMTHPAELPGVGPFPFREVEKERLLEFWRETVRAQGIAVEEGTTLLAISREGGVFRAATTGGAIHAGRVMLALGRRGTPRRLDVPGERTAKVHYRLLDAAEHDGQRTLVVGGGSAALETALSLAERSGADVTLCHRRDVFAGARAALVTRLLESERASRLKVLRNAVVTAIEPAAVLLDVGGAPAEVPNDVVFVMAGGTPPYAILKACGVDFETKFGASPARRT